MPTRRTGTYSSAVDLLPIVAEHPRRPRTIGIAGYPEGHPLISERAIQQALRAKSRFADYMTTQMCFDPDALRSWTVRQREDGVLLPVLVGMPGNLARSRLLEMSIRIAGRSVAALRAQAARLARSVLRSLGDRPSACRNRADARRPAAEHHRGSLLHLQPAPGYMALAIREATCERSPVQAAASSPTAMQIRSGRPHEQSKPEKREGAI